MTPRSMLRASALALTVGWLGACASSGGGDPAVSVEPTAMPIPIASASPPRPDPRVGLRPGRTDPGEAIWNLRMVSQTPKPQPFTDATNSDLAFLGNLVFQGNYNGFMVWDISDPSAPSQRKGFFCPASQSDVSVYRNLLFVSGEGTSGRLDCGGEGVPEPVSHHRLRGIRIFDISDLDNPVNVANVQTCRGSHTHSVLVHPDDRENIYIYVSGSSSIRSDEELAGCSGGLPDENPNTALFRIEVIRVPLADPTRAAIVSSPRIFDDLAPPPEHGDAPADIAARERELAEARRTGGFIAEIRGQEQVLPGRIVRPLLDSLVTTRGGTGAPTARDSAALREILPGLMARMFGQPQAQRMGPTQCHDITLYPEVGLAGGACGGYGLLLDIRNPTAPRRLDAVADSNFSYWHSATFSNDGRMVLFTDEWGGGGAAKCRDTDPPEWGANALFTVEDQRMRFRSYYKIPAPQTELENCVAHNGSLIPIPGRTVMVQGWYQGGISVFDWTDPANPVEIAYHDRGPLEADRMSMAGSWSVYWYNGLIVNSEIARGLDIFRLVPNGLLTENEIRASETVHLDYLNAQGQPQYVWPPSFHLARAFVDQLQRSRGLGEAELRSTRQALANAEARSGSARTAALRDLATGLQRSVASSGDADKLRMLIDAVNDLAEGGM